MRLEVAEHLETARRRKAGGAAPSPYAVGTIGAGLEEIEGGADYLHLGRRADTALEARDASVVLFAEHEELAHRRRPGMSISLNILRHI